MVIVALCTALWYNRIVGKHTGGNDETNKTDESAAGI